MATGLEFCLLGPLTVTCGGTPVPVAPGNQQVLLAALLLSGNQVVAVEELTETLWGDTPPPSALAALRNYVKRLRGALAGVGRPLIGTRPGGYLISVQAGELDVACFEAQLAAARAAARDSAWDTAAARARAALALWRGQPLSGVPSELLAQREVPRLAELRLQAIETRIGASLHLGHHGDVIAELAQLASAHPLREHLHALLMLALYRDGRQGEALAAYQQARRVLAEELGADPGAGLRELHQQILTADPGLAGPVPGRPTTGAPGPGVPRQLPATVARFTGRAAELAELTRLLGQAGNETPGTVVISAIGGTAGVGKTALAIHWAHQAAARFPDGQLYVNLRGYDPSRPVPAADALAGFLRALGVPGQDIPAQTDERAARYRSEIAGRRMLIVLDNAGHAGQVRPLLPATPTCAVVVTSRDALTALVARDGATRLDLDLLPLPDAVSLLRALIDSRADTEPEAATALACRCARLPLALRIAAELAAARPAEPLADLADELADQQHRLDLLDTSGDPHTAVRTVFSWSYQHLDTATASAFRLLGLHPGPDLEPHAAAALTSTTPGQARRLLGSLARAHLIQPAHPGRYAMHDLLRAYARDLAAAHDSQDHQKTALTRLFDHYLHTAATAMNTLHPAERRRRPSIPPPATPGPPVTEPATARAWLDAQRATLIAVAVYTTDHGWPGHATALAATLHRYLDIGGHYPEAITINSHARGAARQIGDRAAEAAALNSLGIVCQRQGRHQQASDHLQQALALYRQASDQTGEARSLSNLGIIDFRQGNYQQATGRHEQALALYRQAGDQLGEARALHNLSLVDVQESRYQQASDHLQQALALSRQTGDQTGQARALNNLSVICLRQGRYQQADGHLRQMLALSRETGDPTGEAFALANIGAVDLRQGRYQRASEHLQQALAMFRETGHSAGEAHALTNIGDLYLRQRRYQQATDHQQRALALSRETGDLSSQPEALNGLGEAFLATGQAARASTQHAAALALANQIGDKYEQARAHYGLARAHQATDEPGQARQHSQQALSLYSSFAAPEADQVRAQLST